MSAASLFVVLKHRWATAAGLQWGWGSAALAALLALGSCATVGSPQGGPRDKTPPRLIGSSPDSAARNVKQQFIRLTFSEPVQVKELPKNLLITPQLAPDNLYTLRQDRESISLLFKKPLDANTTYSFNFRKAIVDVTENLPALRQSLSFSTGPTLDSGRVSGTVTDQLTGRTAKDAVIGLYRPADTVTIRKGQPYYLTRTDEQGKFQLNFVRGAAYRLYAWVDKNNNGRFDDGEKIAYQATPLAVSDTTRPQELTLVRPDRLPPRRVTLDQQADQVRLRYNEGLAAFRVTPLAAGADTTAVQAATQLTDVAHGIAFYKTAALTDGRYLVAATDSAGNTKTDTLALRFPVPTATRKAAPPVAGITLEGNPRTVYRQGQLRFRFPVPVQLPPGTKEVGTLGEDSLKTRPLRLPADATLSADRTTLTVNLDTKAQKYVDIALDSTVLLAVTGQSLHLPKRLRLPVVDQDPAGILLGSLSTKAPQFWLQLLTDKFEVVSQLHSPKGSYRFDHLAPGKYRLRVLIDSNNDGRWQAGDPDLEQPAEPVFLYPKLLDVRAGWETEEKLSF